MNKKISFSNLIPNDLIIITDNEMLGVVFRNLFNNSIKFTPQDGQVILRATKDPAGHVTFYITDTGIGIPGHITDKLFRIGTNSSTSGTDGETGTGLGLALCHEFIGKMGGRIWVKSTSEKGTTFCFSLPSMS